MHRVTKATDVSDTCVVQTRKSKPSSEREGEVEGERKGRERRRKREIEYNVKFSILIILSVQFGGINYIRIVV